LAADKKIKNIQGLFGRLPESRAQLPS
jgi:hypothetical protein